MNNDFFIGHCSFILLPLSKNQWPKQSNKGEPYLEFWGISCFLLDMNKETFITNYCWQLFYDLLSIVDRRVKNQVSGSSQPLMSLGSTDPKVFPTYGLPFTWTNESCLLGKPVWVEFSVLSTKSNQVESKVLTGFWLSYSYCASDGHSSEWVF